MDNTKRQNLVAEGGCMTSMDMSYQQQIYPTSADDLNSMQSMFNPPQQLLQPQPQIYTFPFPTHSSIDSGIGEPADPFEASIYCPEHKLAFVQDDISRAVDFGAYNFMSNETQATGSDHHHTFVPINNPMAVHPAPALVEAASNLSQSPSALATDEAVSVKSEDVSSSPTSPRSQGKSPKTQTVPSVVAATTETVKRVQMGSAERPAVKNGCVRQRKRIPHTAVERRYRENLNLHLENLRCAVPNLQASQRRRSSDINDPLKPSKCEVLVGAVEYIKRLELEVARLKGGG
jgi:hypothetical protein